MCLLPSAPPYAAPTLPGLCSSELLWPLLNATFIPLWAASPTTRRGAGATFGQVLPLQGHREDDHIISLCNHTLSYSPLTKPRLSPFQLVTWEHALFPSHRGHTCCLGEGLWCKAGRGRGVWTTCSCSSFMSQSCSSVTWMSPPCDSDLSRPDFVMWESNRGDHNG